MPERDLKQPHWWCWSVQDGEWKAMGYRCPSAFNPAYWRFGVRRPRKPGPTWTVTHSDGNDDE